MQIAEVHPVTDATLNQSSYGKMVFHPGFPLLALGMKP
jgi:hypothetical protein